MPEAEVLEFTSTCILVLKEQSITDYIYIVVEEGGPERKIGSQVI
jgi:hypothetical protein